MMRILELVLQTDLKLVISQANTHQFTLMVRSLICVCVYLCVLRKQIIYDNCISADTPAPYSELAFLFTDSNLTLTGFSGIEGLTLAIYNAESGK